MSQNPVPNELLQEARPETLHTFPAVCLWREWAVLAGLADRSPRTHDQRFQSRHGSLLSMFDLRYNRLIEGAKDVEIRCQKPRLEWQS